MQDGCREKNWIYAYMFRLTSPTISEGIVEGTLEGTQCGRE